MTIEKNWAGNHTFGFRDVLAPTSLEELQIVVAEHRRIRPLGSRHSFTALADGEAAVTLSSLPEAVTVDAAAGTVTCHGGSTFGALAAHLEPRGHALHNLASLPHISVAGAVSTATHGSGDRNGNLATAVAAVELVTADGELLTLRRGDPGFEGAVVSLGALGVIWRVTLDVEPTYQVDQTVYEGLPWTRVVEDLDAITSAGYSVSLFTDWGPQGASAWVKRRDGDAPAPDDFHGGVAATAARHPLPGLDGATTTEQLGIAGAWSDRLPHFRMGFTPSHGAEIQSEYHVPRELGGAAIEALRAASDGFRSVLQIGEIRTVRRDDLWLSPQYERDTLSLHFTWVREQAAVEEALAVVEDCLAPFDPRPHWGKLFLPGCRPARSYPRLADFLALRGRLDPTGKFGNDWLDRHLDPTA
ncbi:FAD-binding protein [Nocardioides sp. KIGAM211]|uniref:FAD-binding protein n=1 Tax=Nocardioides luti TaxID=2761101 RepID=A0A7X0VBV7_9ACTN|nr:D-arabinono-1,4-lactone oxidase [Nocardioides luti]MBB6628830.1 FAD-binding protein [Nocardioides luti]